MKGQLVLEIDNDFNGRLIMETIEHLTWMTWQDKKRVKDFAAEITKPMREAARARYESKTKEAVL